jgi:hypothetical protein
VREWSFQRGLSRSGRLPNDHYIAPDSSAGDRR